MARALVFGSDPPGPARAGPGPALNMAKFWNKITNCSGLFWQLRYRPDTANFFSWTINPNVSSTSDYHSEGQQQQQQLLQKQQQQPQSATSTAVRKKSSTLRR